MIIKTVKSTHRFARDQRGMRQEYNTLAPTQQVIAVEHGKSLGGGDYEVTATVLDGEELLASYERCVAVWRNSRHDAFFAWRKEEAKRLAGLPSDGWVPSPEEIAKNG